MEIGDFFTSATTSRPVNPKPVKFTAVAKGKTLPDGSANPHGRQIAATVTGSLVFGGGKLETDASVAAREWLAKEYKDKVVSREDFLAELTYQKLFRVLRQWDEEKRAAGADLFPSVDSLRDMVEFYEADRLIAKYNEYVKEEHPEGAPSNPTFRGAETAG